MENSYKSRFVNLVKGIFCFLVFLMIPILGFTQNAGISPSGAQAPNPAAGFDVNFNSKGLLIPRVALTGTVNAAPLAAHVAGMLVYNTATVADVTPGFYYNNGTKWVAGMTRGNAAGDMQYWDGNTWKNIPAGLVGQKLQLNSSNVPTWVP